MNELLFSPYQPRDYNDWLTISIICLNIIISCKGFSDEDFFRKWRFQVGNILNNREYYRIITSGFLHVNFPHLFFNMVALLLTARPVGIITGTWLFPLVYFGSIIFGGLISLFFHKKNKAYKAVGASGGIAGIIFSNIILDPHNSWFIFFPAWSVGATFILLSIVWIKPQKWNIAHEAYLGGAVSGMLILCAIYPSAFDTYPEIILFLALPFILFIFFIIVWPEIMTNETLDYKKAQTPKKIERLPKPLNPQEEIDVLLEKINYKGYDNLSAFEKKRLDELSQE